MSPHRLHITSALTLSLLAALLVATLARVAQLQLAPPPALAAAMSERTVTIPEPGVRGDILDRRGRVLAATRFGPRAFVDPVRFVDNSAPPLSESLPRLADALGLPVEQVALRLVPVIDENDKLAASPRSSLDPAAKPPAPRRYVSLGGVLDDTRAALVKAAALPGVYLELRSVRETPGDAAAASLIGVVGIDHDGLLGAEYLLDKSIRPTPGSITYVRDKIGRPVWIAPGGYVAPTRGNDIRLSIDLELQRIATEELLQGVLAADAAGGRLVLLDPASGEILAIADIIRDLPALAQFPWAAPGDRAPLRSGLRFRTILHDEKRAGHPAQARNRCLEDAYEPGSTFKPFMWSAVTHLRLASPDEVINTEAGRWTPYAAREIKDVAPRAHQSWRDVLVNSSNIGMVKVTSRLSPQQMHAAVRNFGFGSPTGTGLPGESPGIVTPLRAWSKYTHTSVAMGHEVAVTPVQMVRAFSAFARTGDLAGTIPALRLTAFDQTDPGARALPPSVADLTRQTMRGVSQRIDQRLQRTGHDASAPLYDWFGKSGTAEIPLGQAPKGKKRPPGCKGYYPGQYNSSFLAAAPFDNPRLVLIVVIDDPGPALVRNNTYFGSHVAGPVARQVLQRALTYLGEPATPPATTAQANDY